MSEPMHVDVAALDAVALKTEMKGKGEMSLGSPGFDHVASDVRGLRVHEPLVAAQERWAASAKRLSGELEVFAGALGEAAAAVDNTDEEAGKAIERVRVA